MHVDHLGAEEFSQLADFGPVLAIGRHADEDQFPVDVVRLAVVYDFDRIDELLELFANLLDRGVIPSGDDGHPAEGGIMGWGDIQRVDVVAAAAE